MLNDINAGLAAQKPSSSGNSSLFIPSTGAPSQAASGDSVRTHAAAAGPVGRSGGSSGTSFASLEMLVNAVLGRFDPANEQRVVS